MPENKRGGAQTRFKLDPQPLGCGAFGCVFRAYDTGLERYVAVKVPHDAEKGAALRKEAKLMARICELNEPHVVRLHDLHEVGGRDVIVMEFIDGQTLRDMIGKIGAQQPLHLDVALDIAIQTCIGLTALHNAFKQDHIFHRDVKPENLLIRRADGLVKIADFGIARILEQSGYASTTAGTLPYMAPETLTSHADYRADIYGLGVVMYEMTTGQLPFNPLDTEGMAKPPLIFSKEICRGNPTPPGEVAPVPAEISEAILAALQCDLKRRFQEARELHEALVGYQDRQHGRKVLDEARRQERMEDRENALRAAVQQYPTVESFHALAEFYSERLQRQRALEVLRDGMTRCGSPGELFVDLAMVYHQLGRTQQALAVLSEARTSGLSTKTRRVVEQLLKAWRKGAAES